MTTKKENKNLELWNSVEFTDPFATKKVEFGRKFTAIDAYSQIKMATSLWGPYGKGWGVKSESYTFLEELAPAAKVYMYSAEFFYPGGAFPISSTINAMKSSKVDDDFAKKVATDALTKALSKLGFNADVFTGKFDDNKYVEQMKEKFKVKEPDQGSDWKSLGKKMSIDIDNATSIEELIKYWDSKEVNKILDQIREASEEAHGRLVQRYYEAEKKLNTNTLEIIA